MVERRNTADATRTPVAPSASGTRSSRATLPLEPPTVRVRRRTQANSSHAVPIILPPALLVRRHTQRTTTTTTVRRAATATHSVPTVPTTATSDRDYEQPSQRRTLPLMTNSERARYYRQKHANETDALAVTTAQLQREVAYLEIQLDVHRQLAKKRVTPLALRCILTFVQQFVEIQLPTRRHGLEHTRHEIDRVELCGDAQALVVCVVATVRGNLTTRVVHNIYPFVLGNSIVLDALIHDEMAFECCYQFFFAVDGTMERERVEIDAIQGLRPALTDLTTVACAHEWCRHAWRRTGWLKPSPRPSGIACGSIHRLVGREGTHVLRAVAFLAGTAVESKRHGLFSVRSVL